MVKATVASRVGHRALSRVGNADRQPERAARRPAQGLPAEGIGAGARSEHARGAARFRRPNNRAHVARILNVTGDEDEWGRPGIQPPRVGHRPVGQGDNRAGRSHRAQAGHDGRRGHGRLDTVRRERGHKRANLRAVERRRHDRGVLDGDAGRERVSHQMRSIEEQPVTDVAPSDRTISCNVGAVTARDASRHGRRKA